MVFALPLLEIHVLTLMDHISLLQVIAKMLLVHVHGKVGIHVLRVKESQFVLTTIYQENKSLRVQ